MSVHMSVSMEQLGSHWTSFYDILYWGVVLKSVKKI